MKPTKDGRKECTGRQMAPAELDDRGRRRSVAVETTATVQRQSSSVYSKDIFLELRNMSMPVYTSDSDETQDAGGGEFYMVDHGCLTAEQVSTVIAGQRRPAAVMTTTFPAIDSASTGGRMFYRDDGFRPYYTDDETVVETHVLDRRTGGDVRGRRKRNVRLRHGYADATATAVLDGTGSSSDDPTSLQRCRCRNVNCTVYLDIAMDFLAKARQNKRPDTQGSGETAVNETGHSKLRRPCVYERIVKWLTASAAEATTDEEDDDPIFPGEKLAELEKDNNIQTFKDLTREVAMIEETKNMAVTRVAQSFSKHTSCRSKDRCIQLNIYECDSNADEIGYHFYKNTGDVADKFYEDSTPSKMEDTWTMPSLSERFCLNRSKHYNDERSMAVDSAEQKADTLLKNPKCWFTRGSKKVKFIQIKPIKKNRDAKNDSKEIAV